MSSIFCNYCRAQNPLDSAYCYACGKKVEVPLEARVQAIKEETTQSFAAPPLAAATPAIAPEPASPTPPPPDLAPQNEPSLFTSLDNGDSPSVQGSSSALPDIGETMEKGDLSSSLSQEGSKECPKCGLLNPGIAQRCDCGYDFTTATMQESYVPGVGFVGLYATLGQRFTAYFADLIVVYLIVFSVYFMFGFFQRPLSEDTGVYYLVFFSALFPYMVIAQTAYHTTIGKYVHGLEVCSERPNQKYPSFGRIVLRETIGRLLSSLLWGAGYWTASKKPKKQAWSDEVAGTVVTPRRTNRTLVRAFTAFVLVAFVLDVGIMGYGYYFKDRQAQYAALSKDMDTAVKAVTSAQRAVMDNVNSVKPVNDRNDFLHWQDQMRQLDVQAVYWDQAITRVQSLLDRAIRNDLVATANERQQFMTGKTVWDLRKRQAATYRQEANLVIGSSYTRESLASLGNDLKLLDSDIDGFDRQASQLLTEAGIK